MFPFNAVSGRPKPPETPSIIMETSTVHDPMSTTADFASSIKTLMGTIVGLMDDSQKDRVLSTPDSFLSFSTFHPLTASGRQADGRQKLSAKTQLDNAKRIVIETLATGETFWRWVPRARGVRNASEEGKFPRKVSVCGQEVMMGQEQWDIYKLDPLYDCYVPQDGTQTTITPNKGKEKGPPGPASEASSSSGFSKRSFSVSDTDDSMHKTKQRRAYVETDDEEEEEEVSEIVEEMPAGPSLYDKKRQRWWEVEQSRKERREKLAARSARQPTVDIAEELIDLTMDDADDVPVASSSKRAMDEDDGRIPKRKKVRPTFSEQTNDIPFKTRPARKKVSRVSILEKREQEAREARDAAFLEELFTEAAEQRSREMPRARSYSHHSHSNGASSSQQNARHPPPSQSEEPEMEDPIPLEEKIKRMREINERESAQRPRAPPVDPRSQAEAEAREREARKAKEAEQARARSEKAKRRMQQEHPSWAYGLWTQKRALECYRSLSENFDVRKFSAEEPIVFEEIPWPVLHKPGTYAHSDVDWSSVEAFFKESEYHMRSQDYKTFLQTSQRRFHPDRWSARRVYSGVQQKERDELELASGTVSKAIGCLWEDFKKQRA
ncbi:hypothetical protein EUX98_g2384 [Antrodiella citrinella]|uniref:Uncharacterized protein n=1 Tax=Antrodiella citrinella TaxID=2447956 RepID=A0A4S4MZ37_9APHY|nr:hypothetical protein EUX98_g2384 [Antrodiella citrinella]